MIAVLAAIFPIVAILLLGKAVGKMGLVSDEGWLGLESITYYVLFPALIISKLAIADFDGLDWRMPIVLIAAQVLMAGASIWLGKFFSQSGERIGVYVQSGVRWNTFIAIALAQDLMGEDGVILIAVAAAAMVPTSNLLSTIALSHYSSGQTSASNLIRQIMINPLIIASVIGLAINLLQISPTYSILNFMDILAGGAVATGLLASGAYVQLRNASTSVAELLGWSMFRLLGLPLTAGVIAFTFDVSPEMFLVVLIATAVPTASNGAILARKLGGDAMLAANLIAVQTILALVSFTGILWVAAAFGLT
ncbi:COG0679 Predicted permeases [Caulobacteraceae bacterium]